MKDSYIYKDIDQAKAKKKQRLYNRILKMLKSNNNYLIFLTFTFTDETLKSTNERTRERYIKDFLKNQTSEYILNRDYGKKTEREHYHAIAKPLYRGFIDKTDYLKYGTLNAEPINKLQRFVKNNDTPQDIAKRLTEHALKNSTKESRIIYSKINDSKPSDAYTFQIDIAINRAKEKRYKKAIKYLGIADFEEEMEELENDLYLQNQKNTQLKKQIQNDLFK